MNYKKLIIESRDRILYLQLNNLESQNSLDEIMTTELLHFFTQDVLSRTENIIVIKGNGGFFCSGMDLKTAVKNMDNNLNSHTEANLISVKYSELLASIFNCKKITVCCVEGHVKAGGMGLIAASDFVIATPTSTFGLPEILFGLLPANVLPYLVRKIGPAKASRATILHETISASKALELGLVDDVNENVNESLRKLSLKLLRVIPTPLWR